MFGARIFIPLLSSLSGNCLGREAHALNNSCFYFVQLFHNFVIKIYIGLVLGLCIIRSSTIRLISSGIDHIATTGTLSSNLS